MDGRYTDGERGDEGQGYGIVIRLVWTGNMDRDIQ
jgi:hypothetical protein